jgi:selenocysteine lyase/cysteine desulfurase
MLFFRRTPTPFSTSTSPPPLPNKTTTNNNKKKLVSNSSKTSTTTTTTTSETENKNKKPYIKTPTDHNTLFYRNTIIGIDEFFPTPFGTNRLLTYADWTASGRSVHFIEDYIQHHILPRYGNSHTEDDITGRFSTHLLHEAERIIKECVNAGENGKVIEVGTGATGAITKLQEILGVFIPPATRQLLNLLTENFLNDSIKQRELDEFMSQHHPVVLVGPFEHHSNEVSWREGFATVVEVAEDEHGNIDLNDLERLLDLHSNAHLIIGSFSAGSNVTGLIAPVREIARLLHAYGAMACFDFAASGPYVEIDMNPEDDEDGRLDAIFLSPHKFLGGPGSSGLLVFNSLIYDPSLPPSVGGGGTVSYVSPNQHDFISDIEEREKAGTPGMLQVVRASLALDLKRSIGAHRIHTREEELVTFALKELQTHSNIKILGDLQSPRMGIISFIIVDPRSSSSVAAVTTTKPRYLHPKFITVLLNDLFGVQSRGGCSCAGPLGHRLLKIDTSISTRYRDLVVAKNLNGFKPGWTRIGVHYTMDDAEVRFILDCVKFVAEKGYLFLSMYDFDPVSGKWTFSPSIGHVDIFNKKKQQQLPPSEEEKTFGIAQVLQVSNSSNNNNIGCENNTKQSSTKRVSIGSSSSTTTNTKLTDIARHELYKTYLLEAETLAKEIIATPALVSEKRCLIPSLDEFADLQFFNLD